MTFGKILSEGLIGCLFLNEHRYNGVLWTMYLECIGSFLVLGIALLLASPERRTWLRVVLPATFLMLYSENVMVLMLTGFLVGFTGVLLKLGNRKFTHAEAISMVCAALYCLGFNSPDGGGYGWLSLFPLPHLIMKIFLYCMGGLLLLAVFASQNNISRIFTGPVSHTLGLVSFPLYLTHWLIIISFSSWAYVKAHAGVSGVFAAAIMFIIISIPLVLILARFDRWWLRQLAQWHPNKTYGDYSKRLQYFWKRKR